MENKSKNFKLIVVFIIIFILIIAISITMQNQKGNNNETNKNEPKLTKKEQEQVDKAWNIIDAIRIAYIQSQNSEQAVILPYTINFPKGSDKGSENVDWKITDNGSYGKGYINDEPVTTTDENPKGGFVTIKIDGSIIAYQLKIDNYYCTTMDKNDKTKFNSNSMTCSENKNDVKLDNYKDEHIGGTFE